MSLPLAARESGLTKNEIIAQLTKSPHGKLEEYIPIVSRATQEDPEFIAHLMAWNRIHGQVRDSKVAVPVVFLSSNRVWERKLVQNALAHLVLLDPRNLLRALRFSKAVKTPDHAREIRRTVELYLRVREDNYPWFERVAISHRRALKELYSLTHTKPSAVADLILFKNQYPVGSVFSIVRDLPSMSAVEAAGNILNRKIPPLVVLGALGNRLKTEPDIVLAMLEQMSPTEVVTNARMLEKYGVKTNPALRAAFNLKMEEVGKSKKATFKTTRIAEKMEAGEVKEKMLGAQERQIKALQGIEGNWLVLGDKSGSMEQAMEASRLIAGTLATMVKGKVHLIFFDEAPRYQDVSGLDYTQIQERTNLVKAQGATSIGCALQYAVDRGLEFDGIAIASDGAENRNPAFALVLRNLEVKEQREVPVYFYWLPGEHEVHNTLAVTMNAIGHDLQTFNLRTGKVDFYSIPNLVQTMRVKRYSLVDEIMDTPLLTVKDALEPGAMGRI